MLNLKGQAGVLNVSQCLNKNTRMPTSAAKEADNSNHMRLDIKPDAHTHKHSRTHTETQRPAINQLRCTTGFHQRVRSGPWGRGGGPHVWCSRCNFSYSSFLQGAGDQAELMALLCVRAKINSYNNNEHLLVCGMSGVERRSTDSKFDA